jgi:hypothetical protein
MSNRNLPRPLTLPINGHNSDGLQDESLSISEEDLTPTPVTKRQGILSKKNYLLFACDKYGSIDLYQLDGNDPSNAPRHLRQFDLFPGNSTNQKPQIIEAFTVYTPFIVVSARMFRNLFFHFEYILFHKYLDLSDQTDTSSVYFFRSSW